MGEPAPLASHRSLHLSGSGKEGMVPVNCILLETSGCPAVPQREFLSSFFCQTLRRGRALAASQGSPGAMLMAQGLGLIAPLDMLEDADIPDAISSGLLWPGGVSSASLSHQRRVGKSGCINEQPLKPEAPSSEPFPPAPQGAPHSQLLSHKEGILHLQCCFPQPSRRCPLPCLACPLPSRPAKLAAASGQGSGRRLGTALPSPPA